MSHPLSRQRVERFLNFAQLQKIWTLYKANRFRLFFTIVEKLSPVYQSKRVAYVVSITAIANI